VIMCIINEMRGTKSGQQ